MRKRLLLFLCAFSACSVSELQFDGGPEDAGEMDGGLDDASVDTSDGDAQICEPVSEEEICNAIDEDCDGMIDEGFETRREMCNEEDDDCDGLIDENVEAVDEICNGFDDDCDGAIDELVGSEESCNGEDDDCDGLIDEELAAEGCTLAGCESGICSFLMSNLNIPNTAMPTMVAGFDLDGMIGMATTTSCDDVEDFSNGEVTGIDNGFASFATSVGAVLDFDSPISRAFGDGDWAIVFQISGVDGRSDSDVEVEIFDFSERGPGIDYRANQMWERTGGPIATASGSILDGALRVEDFTLPLPFPFAFAEPGSLDTFEFTNAHLTGRISPEGLSEAIFGGELQVDALVDTVCDGTNETIRGLCGEDGGQVRAFLENAAEISPNTDGTVCSHLSAGFDIETVPIVITD